MRDWRRWWKGKKYKIDYCRGAWGVRKRESRLGVVAFPLDYYWFSVNLRVHQLFPTISCISPSLSNTPTCQHINAHAHTHTKFRHPPHTSSSPSFFVPIPFCDPSIPLSPALSLSHTLLSLYLENETFSWCLRKLQLHTFKVPYCRKCYFTSVPFFLVLIWEALLKLLATMTDTALQNYRALIKDSQCFIHISPKSHKVALLDTRESLEYLVYKTGVLWPTKWETYSSFHKNPVCVELQSLANPWYLVKLPKYFETEKLFSRRQLPKSLSYKKILKCHEYLYYSIKFTACWS